MSLAFKIIILFRLLMYSGQRPLSSSSGCPRHQHEHARQRAVARQMSQSFMT